jgi:hypothetical protein
LAVPIKAGRNGPVAVGSTLSSISLGNTPGLKYTAIGLAPIFVSQCELIVYYIFEEKIG